MGRILYHWAIIYRNKEHAAHIKYDRAENLVVAKYGQNENHSINSTSLSNRL